jgi:hypothetical protein
MVSSLHEYEVVPLRNADDPDLELPELPEDANEDAPMIR